MTYTGSLIGQKLLKGIVEDLNNEIARTWSLGSYPEEGEIEFGTRQDVLSPILFNVLVNMIARYEFPGDTQAVIYADDIILQCKGMNNMQEA